MLSVGPQVQIEAVVADVGFAADEPLGEGLVPLEHLGIGLEPMQFLGEFGPEGDGVLLGFVPQRLVLFHRADTRPGGKVC